MHDCLTLFMLLHLLVPHSCPANIDAMHLSGTHGKDAYQLAGAVYGGASMLVMAACLGMEWHVCVGSLLGGGVYMG